MEEQKNKEIRMNAPKEQEKLTYEQLNNACVQLSQENQYLKQQLIQANKVLNTFNRLDYLFKVMETSSKASDWKFADDFVAKCIREIEEIMTLPEEEEKDKEEN